MKCISDTVLGNEEYLRKFILKALNAHIPLSGSFDLTRRCNLKCIHCYLGDHQQSSLAKEIETSQILDIIDQITDAGCLNLLITGGEPLLRVDFPEIYSHAKKSGLIITVFTNGTLITDKILSLFKELPPHKVEISLYGATAQTYEKITRRRGSYDKCIAGVYELLKKSLSS